MTRMIGTKQAKVTERSQMFQNGHQGTDADVEERGGKKRIKKEPYD